MKNDTLPLTREILLCTQTLVNTQFNKFPLVDVETFYLYFREDKNYEPLIEEHFEEVYEKNQTFESVLVDYVDRYYTTIKGDDNFNVISATNEYDFYLKSLRRLVSIDIYMEKITSLFVEKLTPHIEKIEDKMDKICEQYSCEHKKYDLLMEPLNEELKTLLKCDTVLADFSYQVMDFLWACLDADLTALNCDAAKRRYPKDIKLRRCKEVLTPRYSNSLEMLEV